MLGWIVYATVTAQAAPCVPGDADGDTILDVDEDINADGDCDNDDTDADGTANYQDADDDGDGVDTACEIVFGSGHLIVDSDADSVRDGAEWFNFLDPALPAADYQDRNGGLTGFSCFNPWDRDSDMTINALDPDDDGDGFDTLVEGGGDLDCAWPTAVPQPDGIPNYVDFDSDNDQVPDGPDGFGDLDGDTLPDIWDCDNTGCLADSDLDGLANCDETAICQQPNPSDCAVDPDVDNDGVTDGQEIADPIAPQDSDSDGRIDAYDVDDDNDGVPTRLETGFDCAGGERWEMSWDQVVGSWIHFCPLDGTTVTGPFRDTDGDLLHDYLDDDDDDDGVPTVDEDRNNNGDWFDDDDDGDQVPDFLDADAIIATDTDTTDTDTDVPSDSVDSGIASGAKDGKDDGCGCNQPGGMPWLGWIIAVAAVAGVRRRVVSR